MMSRTFLMLACLGGSLLLFAPMVSAETCSTLAHHPLTGDPAVTSCTGNPAHGGTETTDCQGLLFHPLTGDELVWDCQQSQCSNATCWDTLHYITLTPGTRTVGEWSTCGGDPSQTHPNEDSTYCAYGIEVSETQLIAYFSEQDLTSPGVCYSLATAPGWHCIHIVL